MSQVRVILFDLGDTLIQFGQVDRRALFHEGARRTYRLWARRQRRMPDFRRYYLHQWFAVRWGVMKLYLRHREVDSVRLIRRACRKLWLSAPEPFYDELLWHWYAPLAEVSSLEPALHQTLERLTGEGYQLGIVSNTFVPGFVLDRHLRELGLLKFFPTRVYSSDVGYRKPHRQIFRQALHAAGAPAGETMFIGDLLETDVRGARRAGMRSVWKRNPGSVDVARSSAEQPDYVVDHLAQLPTLLAQISAARPAVST